MNIATLSKIAEVFSNKVREVLTEEELIAVTEINHYNARNNIEAPCETTEFIDTNFYLDEAFKAVTGEEIDTRDQDSMSAANDAWILAKLAHFRYTTEEV